MPLKNIADTNQGFADRLKKSFDTKSLRWQDLNLFFLYFFSINSFSSNRAHFSITTSLALTMLPINYNKIPLEFIETFEYRVRSTTSRCTFGIYINK